MGFESFIGNAKAVERLRNKLRQDRFPHALIFSGPEGVGKRTLALMVAKALNCTNRGPTDFCDECSQCRKVNAGTHPDVLQVRLEDEATQIKIAQIRRVLALLGLHPLEGRNKVFIIDPANLMNEESSNALLKGLEEPPNNSFFILLAVNLQELLLTIRSRSQVYQFAPLLLDEIRSRNADELAVRWSQGSIGRAQSLDIAAIKEQREAVLEFFEACVNARDETLREVLNASAELSRTRQDFAAYIHVMAVLLADLLRAADGATERIVNIDILPRLARIAGRAPAQRWIRVAEFLLEVEIALKSHVNRQMLTDVMALQMAYIDGGL
jgi:DNA polymerase III subunit delta'